MTTFSPSEAAFEGFRLIRNRTGAVLIWAGCYIVYALIAAAVMISLFGPQMAAFRQMSQAETSDPHAVLAMMGGMVGLGVVSVPLGLLVMAVFYAAVFRAVLQPEARGFGYLRLGMDELRLIGLWILQFFLFIGLYIGAWIAGLTLFLIAHLVGRASHVEGLSAIVAVIGTLAIVCAFIWILVRLSLASPLTLARGKIDVFGSWRITRGRFWSLLGCYILTFIFGILIAILGGIVALCVGAVVSGDWTTINTLSTNPRLAMMQGGIFSLGKLLTAATIAQIVVSGLLQAVSRTVFLAPFAAAYRDLTAGAAGPMDTPGRSSTGGLVL